MKQWPVFVFLALFCSTVVFAQDGDDNIWQPEPGTSWQWQLTGGINTSWEVTMYDIDLFDTPPATIDRLHTDGRVVICYFSAGSWEERREDASDFPEVVLGEQLEGWEEERWLDISRIDLLEPIMLARLDLAVEKDCDGVEPDNVDAYANATGFGLTYDDQIEHNIWLAEQAHARGLPIGLKNDLGQIDDLVEHFDWALNEECFQYEVCDGLLPFIEAGKAVFGVEYMGDPANYCPQAVAMGFSWLTKTLDLGDEPPGACIGIAVTANAASISRPIRSDGAIQLTIPPPGVSDQNQAFSPDGRGILFTCFSNGYNGGPADIMVLDWGKRDIEQRLIAVEDSDNVNMPGASWNAQTGRIVFSSDREDTDEIWTANWDGNDPVRVTHTMPNFALEPTFSPNGVWIVFEVDNDAPEEEQTGAIWTIRIDGSNLRQRTSGMDYDDRQPNWSPTGERILFQRRAPGTDNWDIYTIASDGSGLRQITTKPSEDTDASWSPNGRQIVYSSNYDDVEVANLFIISADGGEPVRVTSNEAGYDGAPSWSPDGAWIAFESGNDEAPTALWLIVVPPLP